MEQKPRRKEESDIMGSEASSLVLWLTGHWSLVITGDVVTLCPGDLEFLKKVTSKATEKESN